MQDDDERDTEQSSDAAEPAATDAEPIPGTETVTATAGDDDAAAAPGLDRLRGRLESRFGGRPVGAYAVLLAAALVLCLLVAIILATRGNDPEAEEAICYVQPDVQSAKDAVLGGDVARMQVILPENQLDFGIANVTLRMVDGTCFSLTQGEIGQDDAYLVIGAAETYNRTTDQRRVEISWEEQLVPDSVLVTPTVTPTITPTVTATPPPTQTATPSPTATVAPPPVASPIPVSPVASPIASPVVVTVTAAPATPDAAAG